MERGDDRRALVLHAVKRGLILVEDNAQAILAQENGKYTGCIGHIGVFSLNYHKHIHTGEGGVCLTDDDNLALRLQKNALEVRSEQRRQLLAGFGNDKARDLDGLAVPPATSVWWSIAAFPPTPEADYQDSAAQRAYVGRVIVYPFSTAAMLARLATRLSSPSIRARTA